MSKRGGFPGMGGFGGMNINQLMKEAKKMQADMEKSQEELVSKEFEAIYIKKLLTFVCQPLPNVLK